MQEPMMYAGAPFSTQPLPPSQARERRRAWILVLVVLLVVAFVAAGMSWLQWAAHRGLTLGYPQPTVQLTAQPSGTLVLNQSYQFSANSQGRDLTYYWNFGDQNSSSGSYVNHAFQANGNYTVSVTVIDPLGQSSTASTQVTVLPPPPQASFTDVVGSYGYVSFDASGSSVDPSTSITSYNWDFGDGTTYQTSYPGVYHYYSYYGTYSYTVTLTVSDATGQQSTSVQTTISV